MKLDAYLNQSNCESQLIDINKILDKAETKVTYWGTRVVTIENYEDSVSLHTFTKRLQAAAYKRLVNNDLKYEERVAGMEILSKLEKLYTNSDADVKKSKLITKVCSAIQDVFF